MMLQTTAADRIGQGCRYQVVVGVAALVISACGDDGRMAASAATTNGAVTTALSTQPLSSDPCSWLSVNEVSQVLSRTLRGVPVRVASAESIKPSATGAGCMYELEPLRGATAGIVSIEVKIDGAEMQAGLATATGRSRTSAEETWSATWDWVSGVPTGLFAARQGHVGVLVAINDVSLSPMDVEPLAAKVLSKVPDLPFTEASNDPAVAGGDPDPCALMTREEAESVMGPLRFAPFRSQESSPVAHGNGTSCTYYSVGHQVVVLTPTWSDGKTALGRVRGPAGLTRHAAHRGATSHSAEPWDEWATGADGTQYFLKGHRLLQVQHRASHADDADAARVARMALGRM